MDRKLNKDIKALYKAYNVEVSVINETPEDWQQWELKREGFKAQLRFLYYTDPKFNSVSLEAFKTIVVLNRILRAVPFHWFGTQIEIKK